MQDTKLIAEDDKCQITTMPADIVPEDMETRGEQVQNASGIITADQETKRYTAKMFVKAADDSDKVNLTNTMISKCIGKPVEVIKEKDVSENMFLKMDEGDFVNGDLLGHQDTGRSKRDASCSSTRVLYKNLRLL